MYNEEHTKKCPECKENKPLCFFYSPIKRKNICEQCLRKRYKDSKKRNGLIKCNPDDNWCPRKKKIEREAWR